ncbi:hypothetical protein [Bacillus taeanensis]|uniref:Uncharacterized protein n=1 Tax=Bacillus taeanensis TaxID=273032 RepID=A0A366XT25_9BACI|nr:hypothetical protein [Bacillus taeanensis]RBW68305.1 hypothetical protein DS031_17440 [Bacillus taeanensis]
MKNELNGAISGQFCKIVHFTLLSMTNVPVAKLAKRHNEIYDVIIEPLMQGAGEMVLLMKETKQRFEWRDLIINLIILNCVRFILFH